MIVVSKAKLVAVAANRPAGYVEALQAVAVRQDEQKLYLQPRDWVLIAERFGVAVQVPYPRLSRMMRNAAGAVSRAADATNAGKRVKCTPEEETERERICRTSGPKGGPCLAFDADQVRCKLCGCYLRSKLVSKWKAAQESCELGKWPPVTA